MGSNVCPGALFGEKRTNGMVDGLVEPIEFGFVLLRWKFSLNYFKNSFHKICK